MALWNTESNLIFSYKPFPNSHTGIFRFLLDFLEERYTRVPNEEIDIVKEFRRETEICHITQRWEMCETMTVFNSGEIMWKHFKEHNKSSGNITFTCN